MSLRFITYAHGSRDQYGYASILLDNFKATFLMQCGHLCLNGWVPNTERSCCCACAEILEQPTMNRQACEMCQL